MAKPAKAQEPATETLVETVQDNNFADPEPPPTPRGADVEEDINAVRQQRAKDRAARGPVLKRRRVTNYHDAERLRNLVAAGHTHLATPEEIVDWEEAELLPNPAHYATGTTAQQFVQAQQGSITPPSKGEDA
jgi:hypothetical protein